MEEHRVVLLQKNDSPLREMMISVLSQWASDFTTRQDDLPDPAGSEKPLLVVWDLSLFSQEELARLAQTLRPIETGVVVVCHDMSDLCSRTMMACGANAVLAAPRNPMELVAALRLGALNHRRILEGLNQVLAEERQRRERDLIEAAKEGMMMKLGMKESEAMRAMQEHARNRNMRLVEVARFFMDIAPMLSPQKNGD